MLSLIVCSRTPRISEKLEKNIAETIGCEYELLVIDNSKNKYNIFQAYNEGVTRSKGDILCFMHDDILYHTIGWGDIVTSHFVNSSLGVLGVLGSHYMPACPAGWWNTQCQAGCIKQGKTTESGYVTKNVVYNTFDKSIINGLSEVVVVDGLWFCIKRTAFENIEFDANTYNGFHCYDIDICMQVHVQKQIVAICYDIMIEHVSLGSFNRSWIDSMNMWYKKWETHLPYEIGGDHPLSAIRKQEILARNCAFFCHYSRMNGRYALSIVYYLKSIIYFPCKISRIKELIADYIFLALCSKYK